MRFRPYVLFSIFVFLFLVIGISNVSFANPIIEFEGRYWITDLTAKGKVVESGIGTDVNFKSDLGVKDEDFPEARVIWHIGPNSKLRFAYTEIGYSGDKNVERTIEFSGRSYTVGARVTTNLDVKYLRLGWVWQFVNMPGGWLKVGPLLEAKGFLVDTSLKAPDLTPAISESEKFAVGIPTVGAAVDINPCKIINVFTEVSGMSAGKYGYFIDGEVGVKIIPIDSLTIVGGYRILDIELEDSSDYAKLEISGPFIGATLRF